MKRRKIFSLVLAGVMLFSNITSFAAETTEVSESNTEITTESVTTEEISVDETETTTIEISDETASIDETTETSEVTTEEVDEENTYGFVNLSVSYDTLLSDVSFSVYDSNEEQVAVYIVSDAKVSFIDLLVLYNVLRTMYYSTK